MGCELPSMKQLNLKYLLVSGIIIRKGLLLGFIKNSKTENCVINNVAKFYEVFQIWNKQTRLQTEIKPLSYQFQQFFVLFLSQIMLTKTSNRFCAIHLHESILY